MIMSDENMSHAKNIDETRDYLTEEINQNESMSNKYKKVLRYERVLDFIEHLLMLYLQLLDAYPFLLFPL